MTRLNALITWHQNRPRLALSLHLVLSLSFLGAAMIAQYGFDMHPCILCLWQRVPYGLIAILALLSFLLDARWTKAFLATLAGLYAIEAGVAFYHVGVEYHWWASAAGCGFQAKTGADLNALYQQIKQAPVTPCDAVAFRFLGLSMAGWNTVIAVTLVSFTIVQVWVQARGSTATK